MNFSVVIPVYNEEKNISFLINEIISFMKVYTYEIILVNDASEDSTKIIIEDLIKVNKNIFYHQNNINSGQSFSIWKGIELSSYETIITLDGDGQNDPNDIPNMINIYKNNYKKNTKLVSGIRKKRMDTKIKIISSRIANFVRNLILNDKCKDTGCSLKIFDKKTFLSFPYFNGIHRFIPAFFSAINDKSIYVLVNHRLRKFGQSKYGTMGRLFRGIRDIIKVYFMLKQLKIKNRV